MPPRNYTGEQLRRAKELLGIFQEPRPERSAMTFKAISDETGVPQHVVGAFADDAGIAPPHIGRPPGPGKKLGERSPHRARARALREKGFSLRVIASMITDEVRAKAKTAKDKKFKISGEAVRQLLETDDTDKT